jgi:hypothetical protein
MPETVHMIHGQLYSRWGGRCAGPWMHPEDRAEIAATLKDEEATVSNRDKIKIPDHTHGSAHA